MIEIPVLMSLIGYCHTRLLVFVLALDIKERGGEGLLFIFSLSVYFDYMQLKLI